MKRKSPCAELMPPDSGTEMEFVSDSLEYLAHTIEYIGYRYELDEVFETAIARAKSGLNSRFKHAHHPVRLP